MEKWRGNTRDDHMGSQMLVPTHGCGRPCDAQVVQQPCSTHNGDEYHLLHRPFWRRFTCEKSTDFPWLSPNDQHTKVRARTMVSYWTWYNEYSWTGMSQCYPQTGWPHASRTNPALCAKMAGTFRWSQKTKNKWTTKYGIAMEIKSVVVRIDPEMPVKITSMA